MAAGEGSLPSTAGSGLHFLHRRWKETVFWSWSFSTTGRGYRGNSKPSWYYFEQKWFKEEGGVFLPSLYFLGNYSPCPWDIKKKMGENNHVSQVKTLVRSHPWFWYTLMCLSMSFWKWSQTQDGNAEGGLHQVPYCSEVRGSWWLLETAGALVCFFESSNQVKWIRWLGFI